MTARRTKPGRDKEETMQRFAITTFAALGLLLGTVPVARAADATCGTQTISNATIGGNLVVTGFCTLGSDVTVGGNVTVAAGADLQILPTTSPVKIGGNVIADGCFFVFILASPTGPVTIGGNVEIEGCGHTEDSSGYNGNGGTLKIGGNFTCTGDSAGCVAESGLVGGNVKVDGNGAISEVVGNTIGGNLTCTGNNGGVFSSGNTVGGRRLPSPGTQCPN
jgi:hypothetical protein